MYLDGVQVSKNLSTSALAGAPTTLHLNQSGVDFTANAKYHYMAGYASQITDAEHAQIADNPAENIRNRNYVLAYTGSLDLNDILEFERVDGVYKGRKFDVSVGTAATTVWPDDGTVIPPLPQQNTSIYVAAGAARLDVQYRKTYL